MERTIKEKVLLTALIGSIFLTSPAASVPAAELTVEHVLNIASDDPQKWQLGSAEALALSTDGRLLVTDAADASILMFDKQTGKLLNRFGGRGDGEQNFDKPEGIAVDDGGNTFIVDYVTGSIKKFSPDFKWLVTFSEYGSGLGQNKRPEHMTIQGDRLCLADAGNSRIDVFDLNGKPLFHFGKRGSGNGELRDPETAIIGKDGNFYVTDLGNDRIAVFDPEGRFIKSIGHSGTGAGEFKSPAGIAFDGEGNLYVSEIGNDRVQIFDQSGRPLAMWGKHGSGNGEFEDLHGIAIDKATGLVYVADTGNHRIQVFRRAKPPSN